MTEEGDAAAAIELDGCPVIGMIAAERAMRGHSLCLRKVKLVSQRRAIARWKAAELGWRRVA